MREAACLIRIRMKRIAGEIRAVKTEGYAFLLSAGIDGAFHGQDRTLSFHITATWTSDFLLRYTKLLGNPGPYFQVVLRQVNDAVEASQTTWRRHLLVVHLIPLHPFSETKVSDI